MMLIFIGKKIKRRKKRGRQDTEQPRSAKWVKAIHSVKHEEDEFIWKSDCKWNIAARV